MRLYLVRHGETALNQKGCYYGKTDAVLSERGIAQAKALHRCLGEIPFDYVVASPLVRAYNTAELIVPDLAGEILVDARLSEQDFGIFEGCTYQELTERYPRELAAWNAAYTDYVIPEGESFLAVRRRVEAFLEEVPRKPGAMLLVAHKGTLGHLLAAMLGLSPEGYWNFVFEQGCFSVVDLEDGYAILRKINVDKF